MKKGTIWACAAAAAFAAAGICLFVVWKDKTEKKRTEEMYQQLRQEMRLDETEAEDAGPDADEQGPSVPAEDRTEAGTAETSGAEKLTEAGTEEADGSEAAEKAAQEPFGPESGETGTDLSERREPEADGGTAGDLSGGIDGTDEAQSLQETEGGGVASGGTEPETEEKKSSKKIVWEEELTVPVDFEGLEKINPDIYAWITIPGTVIDYPIVQNEDNAYYLNRDAEGKESASGAIYSEKENDRDFSDVHTVLYGHNMKDGSMFAGLHQFEDETFFREHKEIAVYTPDAVRYYRIFAAYLYDNRHLLQSFDCEDPRVFSYYIRSILEQRSLYCQIDPKVTVEEGDQILTLSTCHKNGSEYRYLVQAVLEEEHRQKKE